MRGPTSVEVLLALLEPGSSQPCGGDEVVARLASAGVTASPSTVLATLLRLEDSGHVRVERTPRYRFGLSRLGEDAVYELGPGRVVDVTLVFADLVGFVAFTERAGDTAAHAVALTVSGTAARVFSRGGGELVKSLGDGVLATAPSVDTALAAVSDLARACSSLDGESWQLRAAIHEGHPVSFRGDLFGADVNLVSRLCDLAPEGHALVTGLGGEPVEVRGLREPVPVLRVPL